MTQTLVSHQKLRRFACKLFESTGLSHPIYDQVVNSLVDTSVRGVDSHGMRLIPHYLQAIILGRINKNPKFSFKKTAASTGILDADHGFGIIAGLTAINQAINLAQKTGIGAVAVKNSSHFAAAAIYSLKAAKTNMIGLSFTHTASLVLPFNGKRPFLGTNPICFCAPIEGEDPFCLDMATSQVSWNKVLDYKAKNIKLETGWACDHYGNPTTDPKTAEVLLPMAGYKGYGLALMVEIICSLLTQMPFGHDIKKMYPVDNQRRRLGHFFMALDISKFVSVKIFKKRIKQLCDQLRHEPSVNGVKVMVPGDPEKITAKNRRKTGIPLSSADIENFRQIAQNLKVKFSLM